MDQINLKDEKKQDREKKKAEKEQKALGETEGEVPEKKNKGKDRKKKTSHEEDTDGQEGVSSNLPENRNEDGKEETVDSVTKAPRTRKTGKSPPSDVDQEELVTPKPKEKGQKEAKSSEKKRKPTILAFIQLFFMFFYANPRKHQRFFVA